MPNTKPIRIPHVNSCKVIVIPLPTKRLRVPVMRTPCGDGMHRGGGGGNWETWEMRIHKRILDVGANERVLRQITRIRIPRDVNIEIELTD